MHTLSLAMTDSVAPDALLSAALVPHIDSEATTREPSPAIPSALSVPPPTPGPAPLNDSDSDHEPQSDASRRSGSPESSDDSTGLRTRPSPAIRRTKSSLVAGSSDHVRVTKHLRFTAVGVPSNGTAGGKLDMHSSKEVIYPGGIRVNTEMHARSHSYYTEPGTPNLSET